MGCSSSLKMLSQGALTSWLIFSLSPLQCLQSGDICLALKVADLLRSTVGSRVLDQLLMLHLCKLSTLMLKLPDENCHLLLLLPRLNPDKPHAMPLSQVQCVNKASADGMYLKVHNVNAKQHHPSLEGQPGCLWSSNSRLQAMSPRCLQASMFMHGPALPEHITSSHQHAAGIAASTSLHASCWAMNRPHH